MTTKEIRTKAWNLLWNEHYLGKLFFAATALHLLSNLIKGLIEATLSWLGVATLKETLNNFQRDGLPLLGDFFMEYSVMVAMIIFFGLLMTGITNYGTSKILNNTADNDPTNFYNHAFAGFKVPFEALSLQFVLTLISFLIALICALPALVVILSKRWPYLPSLLDTNSQLSIYAMALLIILILALSIPFYRYRYTFRVKADHPDWTAWKCLRHASFLSSGNIWHIIKLDLSYFKVFLIPLFVILIPIGNLSIIICTIIMTIVTLYNGVGQSILYREISNKKPIA